MYVTKNRIFPILNLKTHQIQLIRQKNENKKFFWDLSSQPTDHGSAVVTIMPQRYLQVGDFERLWKKCGLPWFSQLYIELWNKLFINLDFCSQTQWQWHILEVGESLKFRKIQSWGRGRALISLDTFCIQGCFKLQVDCIHNFSTHDFTKRLKFHIRELFYAWSNDFTMD